MTEVNYDLLNDVEPEDDISEILIQGREDAEFMPEFDKNTDVFDEKKFVKEYDIAEDDAGAAENTEVFAEAAEGDGEEYSYGEKETDENNKEEFLTPDSVEERPARTYKIFKFLFAAAVILLAAELVWLFVITPLRPFSVVSVTGIDFSLIERDYVLLKAGINDKSSYLFFDEKRAEKAFMEIPLVENANVEKHFPGTISVNITQRKACAVCLISANGKTIPAYIDKHGVIFMAGSSSGSGYFLQLPVISGLETGNITLGERLSSVYLPLFESLNKLLEKAPELLDGISEIEINKKAYDGFDVTVYTSHSPVRIKMNKSLDEETIRYMFLLLDVLEAKNERVNEIDFRAGTVSYFIK